MERNSMQGWSENDSDALLDNFGLRLSNTPDSQQFQTYNYSQSSEKTVWEQWNMNTNDSY